MEEKEKKPGFFKRLVSGLTKTRDLSLIHISEPTRPY